MMSKLLLGLVVTSLATIALAVDPDPTSLRTAIDTLEPQVKSQASDISKLKNDLFGKATIGDGAQVQSAMQRVNAALTNGASNETVSQLQKEALGLFGSVNDALAATSSVSQVMQDARDTAHFAEAQCVNLIDEAATATSQIDDARERLNGIVTDADERADAFPIKADVFDELEASLSAFEDEIDEMLETVAEFPEAAAQRLSAIYNNNAGFKGSNVKPVYRYGVFDTYGPHGGWTFGNQQYFFGDVNPSGWSGGNRAYHISTDMDHVRAMATETGFLGPQGNIFARDKYYYSASDMNRVLAVVFRIKNTSPSTVSHTFYWYYSAYGGWSDYSSVSLNDNSNWYENNYCSGCSRGDTFSFPGNKISTMIWMMSASPRQNGRRVPILHFYNNCMRLPSQLQWIDDFDTATAWMQ